MQICKEIDRLNKLFNNELIFTSWIKDIAEFNAGMDIICLTSDNEGTPVSLIEAQASNVAVISSDVGGVKDIVNEGETGFIVPKGNLEEYVQKLGLLIKNKELRTRFSENGWGFVKERFHYTRLTSDMEALYYELITKSNEKKLR